MQAPAKPENGHSKKSRKAAQAVEQILRAILGFDARG